MAPIRGKKSNSQRRKFKRTSAHMTCKKQKANRDTSEKFIEEPLPKLQLKIDTITSKQDNSFHFTEMESNCTEDNDFLNYTKTCNSGTVEVFNNFGTGNQFNINSAGVKVGDISEYNNIEQSDTNYDPDSDKNDSEFDDNSPEFMYFSDVFVIILPKNSRTYFQGLMSIQVLHGAVEVLGYTLTKSSAVQELYSPRGSSLLYINNGNHHDDFVDKDYIHKTLSNEDVEPENINGVCDKTKISCAVILCKKINSIKINFLKNHIAQQIFPDSQYECCFDNDIDNGDVININPKWDSIINKMSKRSKTFLGGGKSVGKSTALRYMVNKLLLQYKEVLVIDLDPGQPEFTVPGCISATIVTEPIFGPNYTHLRQPYRCLFLPTIEVSSKPNDYLKLVKILLGHCENIKSMPTIINYMGFTRGFGLNIFSAVVMCVQPTFLIEIKSANSKRNFSQLLTRKLIERSASLLITERPIKANFHICRIASMTDTNTGWHLQPRQIREMIVLCYLSSMLSGDNFSITDVTNYSYMLHYSTIRIIHDEKIISPAAVNANLVALCASGPYSRYHICYGWGIVRAVNVETGQLFLMTPTPVHDMERVDTLILGSVALPPSLYMTSRNVQGLIPYVAENILPTHGQISKRSHLPPNRN